MAGWQDLFPIKSDEMHLQDAVMRYVDVGSGPVVLMVHGNPTWSFYYHELIRRLSSSYRCVAPDHVGCGRSDKPQKYDYCLDRHVENLSELVERMDLKGVTLVAHDWGGAIGLGTLLENPARFSRIILLNTGAFPPPFFPLRIRACRLPVLGRIAVQGLNLFAKSAVKMATSRSDGLPREIAAGLLAPYNSWSNRIATYEFVADIPTTPKQRTWQTLETIERRLAKISQKKLLIWGMRDWCFRPECLDRFLKHWPDAEVERLAEAGHYVLLDQPDVVISRIERFLAS